MNKRPLFRSTIIILATLAGAVGLISVQARLEAHAYAQDMQKGGSSPGPSLKSTSKRSSLQAPARKS